MPDLLIELFSEEIPARMQGRAAEDLKKLVTDHMVEAGLTYAAAAAFATPRRLCLAVEGLPKATRATREERKGPRADAPEKAVAGFLRSTGLTMDQLERRADKKGEVLFAVIEKPGREAAEVVAEALEQAIRNFPWPKSMRWGSGSLRWVRPLHSIICLLSDDAGPEIVPLDIDGIRAGDMTWGHRFMAPGAVQVSGFEDYRDKLAARHVVLDPAERAERIRHDADQAAFGLGMEIVEDKGLLAEVAGLVEWPVVLMGPIGEKFLGLPPEVLQTSMKEHQKFFSVRNPATGRIEKFVTVANRETADAGATILEGNGRVLAARLSDALFFWENDLRKIEREGKGMAGLEAMAAPLANVTFHNKLGSQADRIARIAALAREIAPAVGADPALAEQAAKVAKADLASEMVYEFPELQGVMGGYYARAAGLSEEVAEACAAHYAPLGPGDAAPTAPVSVAVALADKIDMLACFWCIDEKPTGSKDPFALRRAAIGIIRIITTGGVRVSLEKVLMSWAEASILMPVSYGDPRGTGVPKQRPKTFDRFLSTVAEGETSSGDFYEDQEFDLEAISTEFSDLLAFLADRLKVHLRGEGVRHDVIEACFQLGGQDDLVLLVARVKALQAFVETEDGANLLQGHRRAVNILTAEEKKDGIEYSLDPDVKFAEGAEETALFAALDAAEPKIAAALAEEDFAAAMTAMAGLRAPIDAFFEAVQVNSDNGIIRRNRLCLLNRIRVVMQRVAVFGALEG
ncbi:glycyl-tRNA synthetase beta chain [Albimonas donghaensis]|uniref:Glycine--tRNA ligase beta subunit n=1 Tax=Albimonas donghaensis TaxID=356660 RepID=A0A1H2RPF9_9RHOB|nr:glycine--tRNA ligase subunit beta [Albimonas donghaensis]SDW21403.1 glycyl-tRNA synthetase beta chain [Albimonas donghaensis]